MNSNKETENLKVSFLSFLKTLSEDGYIGSILVTDIYGIPQEFRCTYPVKPTTIQKTLYGEILETYIGVNLCGIPLLKSIQQKPELIIVNKIFLLDIRKELNYPLVYLRRAGEVIDLSTDNKISENKERIDSPGGKFQPIVFYTHPDFKDDSKNAREILEKIFQYLDPLEPFDRINKAIEVLSKEDSRFK